MRTRLKLAVMVPAFSVLLSGCCLTQGDSTVVCVDGKADSGRNDYRDNKPNLPSIDIPRYDWDG